MFGLTTKYSRRPSSSWVSSTIIATMPQRSASESEPATLPRSAASVVPTTAIRAIQRIQE